MKALVLLLLLFLALAERAWPAQPPDGLTPGVDELYVGRVRVDSANFKADVEAVVAEVRAFQNASSAETTSLLLAVYLYDADLNRASDRPLYLALNALATTPGAHLGLFAAYDEDQGVLWDQGREPAFVYSTQLPAFHFRTSLERSAVLDGLNARDKAAAERLSLAFVETLRNASLLAAVSDNLTADASTSLAASDLTWSASSDRVVNALIARFRGASPGFVDFEAPLIFPGVLDLHALRARLPNNSADDAYYILDLVRLQLSINISLGHEISTGDRRGLLRSFAGLGLRDCAQQCASDSRCTHFSVACTRCQLWTGKPDPKRLVRSNDLSRTVGFLDAVQAKVFPGVRPFFHYSFIDAELTGPDCFRRCVREPRCIGSLVYTKRCLLYDAASVELRRDPGPGVFEPYFYPAEAARARHENLRLFGHYNLDAAPTNLSAEECHETCLLDARCLGSMRHPTDRRCLKYDSTALESNRESNYTSFVIAPAILKSQSYANVALFAGVRAGVFLSAEDCFTACAKRPDCVASTVTSESECLAYTESTQVVSRGAGSQVLTFSRFPFLQVYRGLALTGVELPPPAAAISSDEDCFGECQASSACVASVRDAAGVCHLYENVTGLTRVSGSPDVRTYALLDLRFDELAGVRLLGHYNAVPRPMRDWQCHQACLSDVSCVGSMLRRGRCYLYDAKFSFARELGGDAHCVAQLVPPFNFDFQTVPNVRLLNNHSYSATPGLSAYDCFVGCVRDDRQCVASSLGADGACRWFRARDMQIARAASETAYVFPSFRFRVSYPGLRMTGPFVQLKATMSGAECFERCERTDGCLLSQQLDDYCNLFGNDTDWDFRRDDTCSAPVYTYAPVDMRKHVYASVRGFGHYNEPAPAFIGARACFAECLACRTCIAAQYSRERCYLFDARMQYGRETGFEMALVTADSFAPLVLSHVRFSGFYAFTRGIGSEFACFQACMREERCVAASVYLGSCLKFDASFGFARSECYKAYAVPRIDLTGYRYRNMRLHGAGTCAVSCHRHKEHHHSHRHGHEHHHNRSIEHGDHWTDEDRDSDGYDGRHGNQERRWDHGRFEDDGEGWDDENQHHEDDDWQEGRHRRLEDHKDGYDGRHGNEERHWNNDWRFEVSEGGNERHWIDGASDGHDGHHGNRRKRPGHHHHHRRLDCSCYEKRGLDDRQCVLECVQDRLCVGVTNHEGRCRLYHGHRLDYERVHGSHSFIAVPRVTFDPVVYAGIRLVNPYNATNSTSDNSSCFQRCAFDPACVASAVNSTGACLFFNSTGMEVEKNANETAFVFNRVRLEAVYPDLRVSGGTGLVTAGPLADRLCWAACRDSATCLASVNDPAVGCNQLDVKDPGTGALAASLSYERVPGVVTYTYSPIDYRLYSYPSLEPVGEFAELRGHFSSRDCFLECLKKAQCRASLAADNCSCRLFDASMSYRRNASIAALFYVPPSPIQAVETQGARLGGAYNTATAPDGLTAEQCFELCLADEPCVGATLDPPGIGKCLLFAANLTFTKDTAYTALTFPEAAPTLARTQAGVRLLQPYSTPVGINETSECQRLCFADPVCVAFTADIGCSLFDATYDYERAGDAGSGYYSLAPLQFASVDFPVTLTGAYSTVSTAQSAAECFQLCAVDAEHDCVASSFQASPAPATCSLFDRNARIGPRVSGSVVNVLKHFDFVRTYPALSISATSLLSSPAAFSAEDCASQCLADAACLASVYSASGCWLHNPLLSGALFTRTADGSSVTTYALLGTTYRLSNLSPTNPTNADTAAPAATDLECFDACLAAGLGCLGSVRRAGLCYFVDASLVYGPPDPSGSGPLVYFLDPSPFAASTYSGVSISGSYFTVNGVSTQAACFEACVQDFANECAVSIFDGVTCKLYKRPAQISKAGQPTSALVLTYFVFFVQFPSLKLSNPYSSPAEPTSDDECFQACQAGPYCVASSFYASQCNLFSHSIHFDLVDRAPGYTVYAYAWHMYMHSAFRGLELSGSIGTAGLTGVDCINECLKTSNCFAVTNEDQCLFFGRSAGVRRGSSDVYYFGPFVLESKIYTDFALTPIYSSPYATSVDDCFRKIWTTSRVAVASSYSLGVCNLYTADAAISRQAGVTTYAFSDHPFFLRLPDVELVGSSGSTPTNADDAACLDLCLAQPDCLASMANPAGFLCSFYPAAFDFARKIGRVSYVYASFDFLKYRFDVLDLTTGQYALKPATTDAACFLLCMQDAACFASVLRTDGCHLHGGDLEYGVKAGTALPSVVYYKPPSPIRPEIYLDVELSPVLTTVSASDEQDCFLQCAKTLDTCVASSWNAGTCSLFDRTARVSKTAGARLSVSRAFPFVLTYPDIRLTGHYQVRFGAYSNESCFAECRADPLCVASSASLPGQCAFYAATAGYERASGFVAVAYALVELQRYARTGLDSASFYYVDLGANHDDLSCLEACLLDARCTAARFDTVCRLFDESARLASPGDSFSYVPPFFGQPDVYTDVALSGGTAVAGVATEDDCFVQCLSSATCVASAFDATGCQLYPDSAILTRAAGKSVSVRRSFDFSAIFPSLKFTGAYSVLNGSFTNASCFERCKADVQCLASSATAFNCSLFSAVAYERAAGFTATTYALVDLGKYTFAGLRPNSAPYSSINPATTSSDCLAKCLRDPKCVAVFLDPADFTCGLYDETVTYFASSDSSFFFVPPSAAQPIVYTDVQLTGASSTPVTTSASECFEKCYLNAPNCVASAFVSGTCSLFPASATLTRAAGKSVSVRKTFQFTVVYSSLKLTGSYSVLDGSFTNATCFDACKADPQCMVSVATRDKCSLFAANSEYQRASGSTATTYALADLSKYTFIGLRPSSAAYSDLGYGLSAAACLARCLLDPICVAVTSDPATFCRLFPSTVVYSDSNVGRFFYVPPSAAQPVVYTDVLLAGFYSSTPVAAVSPAAACFEKCYLDTANCVASATNATLCLLYGPSAVLTRLAGSQVLARASFAFTVLFPSLQFTTGAYATLTGAGYTDASCFGACQADSQCLFSSAASSGNSCAKYGAIDSVTYTRMPGFTVAAYAMADVRRYTLGSLRPSRPFRVLGTGLGDFRCHTLCLADAACAGSLNLVGNCTHFDLGLSYTASGVGSFNYVPPNPIQPLVYTGVALTNYYASPGAPSAQQCFERCFIASTCVACVFVPTSSGSLGRCLLYNAGATLSKSAGSPYQIVEV